MKQLWAPWRIEYILGKKADSCPFCLPNGRDEDEERLVLFRGRKSFVIMNKCPYANGHLMVVPYYHAVDFCRLDQETVLEMTLLLQKSTETLQRASTPDGVNIGMNIGEAAGAGIREHVHFHIVPRWVGDSSFIAVMDEVRLIPEHIKHTYQRLKPLFDAISL